MARQSVFAIEELAYLHGERRLGRIATVGIDGSPHVVPTGWTHNVDQDSIDVTGRNLEETRKFRDVARNARAAIVIDDIASLKPFRPRAIEVRGTAEVIFSPEPLIRIYPERILSWGLGPDRNARSVHARSLNTHPPPRTDEAK